MSVPDFGDPARPDIYPGVVRARGGWFAMQDEYGSASGPWLSEASARLALAERYEEAHKVDRTQTKQR